MPDNDCTPSPPSLPSPPAMQSRAMGPLRLRVIGTARHGQFLQFDARRVTIGSAPNCTLRLRSVGVRPLQCLVVRGPSGATARSLSVDTLLNGQRFRDEKLYAGDRLRVGSIELEVCDDGAMSLPGAERASVRHDAHKKEKRPLASATADWLRPGAPRPLEVLDRITRLERQFEHLRVSELPPTQDAADGEEGGDAAAAERQQLIEQLEQANQRHESLLAELETVRAERSAIQVRCDELEQTCREAEDRWRQLQLETEDRGFEHQIQQTRDELARLQSDWAHRLTELTNEIEQLQQELAGREQRNLELDRLRLELEASLSQEQEQRATLESQLQLQTVELTTLLSLASDRPSEVAQISAEPALANSGAPSQRRAELARLTQQLASVEGDDRRLDPRPDSQTTDRSISAPTADQPTIASDSSDKADRVALDLRRDEDSIETYMQRLLERIRGESGTATGSPVPANQLNRAPQSDVPVDSREPIDLLEPVGTPARTGPQAPVDATESPPLTETEYVPRSQAPEVNGSLAAMRALANDNRHKHILSHAQRTWTSKSQNLITGSVAAVATAVGSFFFLETHTLPASVGLLSGLGVAGFWTWQVFKSRRQLFDELRLNTDKSNVETAVSPD